MSDVPTASIPKSWIWARIQDVAATATGGTPSRSMSTYFGGNIPWVKSGELGDGHVFDTEETLSELGLKSSNAKLFPKGTLCIALYGATVGKLGILEVDAATNQAVCGLFLPDEVHRDFVFYYLASIRRHLIEQGKGGAQSNISNGLVRQTRIPIAPLNEQVRIVAKIEELFSDLDAGVAALKRAKANLKRYRASVLKAAVEGELTEQLGNYHFKKSNWIEIGTLLTCVEQGWSPKCERESSSSDDEWAVMKTSAVLPMQFLAHENKRLPMNLTPEIQFEVKVGDLLITRAGPRNRAAVTCLVRSSRPRLIVCDKVYRIRCDHSQVIPSYLEIALNSPPILDELDDMKTGISDSGVNLTQQKFRKIMIPIPPLPSQRQIVDEVEERLSVVTLAEKQIEHGLLRAARLRQSILKRAFEGKLVPQDPKDEPASTLLERLRASRTHDEANGTAATSKQTRAKIKESSGEPRTRIRRRASTRNQQEE